MRLIQRPGSRRMFSKYKVPGSLKFTSIFANVLFNFSQNILLRNSSKTKNWFEFKVAVFFLLSREFGHIVKSQCFQHLLQSLHYTTITKGANCLEDIVGFHMTSLKFKLKNYRSYRGFTFTMHQSSLKLVFIQSFQRVLGFVIECTIEFLSFCVTRHSHDGQESCHVG